MGLGGGGEERGWVIIAEKEGKKKKRKRRRSILNYYSGRDGRKRIPVVAPSTETNARARVQQMA